MEQHEDMSKQKYTPHDHRPLLTLWRKTVGCASEALLEARLSIMARREDDARRLANLDEIQGQLTRLECRLGVIHSAEQLHLAVG